MKHLILPAVLLSFFVLSGQLVDQAAPQMAGVENDPFANFHQRWTPSMQKLFQLVRDDDGKVTHYVGAEVGTPYETTDFKKGHVWYKDEDLGEFFYRFNIFSNEIELKRTQLQEEKHQALIRDPNVVLVSNMKDKEYYYLSFISDKTMNKEGYLIRLYNGSSFKLYKHLESKFTEAKPAANSMVNPTPSKFTTFSSYLLQKNDREIREISLKKNKFLKQLDANSAEKMKAYIKENKIDLSEETQLIRAISHMEEADL
ncbi:MAG: hypothetical protein HKO11_01605 [Eudoraea sp.]|nr:hypothetical protein [Eudoraea sp.]